MLLGEREKRLGEERQGEEKRSCLKLPPSQAIRILWRLSRTLGNAPSSTSHLVSLISVSIRHVQPCDAVTPGYGDGRSVDLKLRVSPSKAIWKTHFYANLVCICPVKREREAEGGMFLLLSCLLLHTPPSQLRKDFLQKLYNKNL